MRHFAFPDVEDLRVPVSLSLSCLVSLFQSVDLLSICSSELKTQRLTALRYFDIET
jgi:hypothetical protein